MNYKIILTFRLFLIWSKGFVTGFSIGFEGPRMPRFSHNLKMSTLM